MMYRLKSSILLVVALAALSTLVVSRLTNCVYYSSPDNDTDEVDCRETESRHVHVVIERVSRDDEEIHYAHHPVGYRVDVQGAGISVENFLKTGDGERASILSFNGNVILRLRSSPYVFKEYFWAALERASLSDHGSESSVGYGNDLLMNEVVLSEKTYIFIYTQNCAMTFIVKDGLIWPVSGTSGHFGLARESDAGIVGGEDIGITVMPDGIWPVTEDDIDVLRTFHDEEWENVTE